MLCLRELIFAGQADARVQEANLNGCAKADTVVFMQKGGLNFLYPLSNLMGKMVRFTGSGFNSIFQGIKNENLEISTCRHGCNRIYGQRRLCANMATASRKRTLSIQVGCG